MDRKKLISIVIGVLLGGGLGIAISAIGQSLTGMAAQSTLALQPGAAVTGAATAIVTHPYFPNSGIASENGINALGAAIIANANDIGAHEAADQARTVAAMSNIGDSTTVVNGAIQQKSYIATALTKLQDQMAAPGSHTVYGCDNTLVGTTQNSITAYRSSVGSALNRATLSRLNSSVSANNSHVAEAILQKAQVDVSAIFPTGSANGNVGNGSNSVASPQDAKNAVIYASTVTDPYPVPRLPTAVQSKINSMTPSNYPPSVMQYEAEKNVWDSKMGLATHAFANIASYYAPLSTQNAWTKAAYKSMGVAPPSTDISEMALLALEVKSRTQSPIWYTHIEGDTTAGLLREIALMDAVNMDINLRRLKETQLQLAISAAQYADQVNQGERTKYMDAYNGVIAASRSAP